MIFPRESSAEYAMELDEAISVAREISSGVVAADADGVDREARWPRAGLRALLEGNLGGLVVPREHGGLGLGMSGLLRVCEELGQECGSTSLCFGMHAVGSAVIAAKATREQRAAYLEPIVRGEHLTTLALSEPGTGAHFQFPQTRIEPTEAGYRVCGTKSFVTNGSKADSYVVSGIVPGLESDGQRFSCLLLRGDCPGLSWQEPWNGFGMRGNSSRTAVIEDAEVPRENLLGEQGDQLWYVFQVVAPYFLTAMTGTYVGIASVALELARASIADRTYDHSGEALSRSDVMQHDLGELWAQVERTRRLAYFAAEEADRGGPRALPAVLVAKGEAADCAVQATDAAMALMGGRAYANGGRLPRFLRDARAAHVMAPTTQLVRLWCGRYLLEQPLLS